MAQFLAITNLKTRKLQLIYKKIGLVCWTWSGPHATCGARSSSPLFPRAHLHNALLIEEERIFFDFPGVLYISLFGATISPQWKYHFILFFHKLREEWQVVFCSLFFYKYGEKQKAADTTKMCRKSLTRSNMYNCNVRCSILLVGWEEYIGIYSWVRQGFFKYL